MRPLICSFPPIAAPDARVLVLGTVPSIASLAKQQYYGHPQNAFWPIMGRLFGAGPELPYEERKRILCEHGVAVWDVLRECYREGSLDSAIRSRIGIAERFRGVLSRAHPADSRTIFFNGQKRRRRSAGTCCRQLTNLDRELRYVRLPSTSPAHAGRNFAQKLAAWRAWPRAQAKN